MRNYPQVSEDVLQCQRIPKHFVGSQKNSGYGGNKNWEGTYGHKEYLLNTSVLLNGHITGTNKKASSDPCHLHWMIYNKVSPELEVSSHESM